MVWLEVETKVAIPKTEVSKIRNKIKKIAKLRKKGKKEDDYFAIKRKGYPKKAFRIRAIKDNFEVTFKKWLVNLWTKEVVVKQEYEFKLKGKEEVDNLLELFRDLGFEEWIKKIKWNETYSYNKDKKLNIEINRVKHLGYFLEIEFLARKNEVERARNKIVRVLKELEIPNNWIDNTGYTKMLWYKGTKGKHDFLK